MKQWVWLGIALTLLLSARHARADSATTAGDSEKASAENGDGVETGRVHRVRTIVAPERRRRRRRRRLTRAAQATPRSRAKAPLPPPPPSAPVVQPRSKPSPVDQNVVLSPENLPEVAPPLPPAHPVAAYFSLGGGGGIDGLTGRMGLGVEPWRIRRWTFGGAFGAGLTGAGPKPGWIDLELTAQVSREKPLTTGRLVFAAGAGPALARSPGHPCNLPLCGEIAPIPFTLMGAFQVQTGWWTTSDQGVDLGLFVGAQCLTNALFDFTFNVVVGINNLADLAPMVQGM